MRCSCCLLLLVHVLVIAASHDGQYVVGDHGCDAYNADGDDRDDGYDDGDSNRYKKRSLANMLFPGCGVQGFIGSHMSGGRTFLFLILGIFQRGAGQSAQSPKISIAVLLLRTAATDKAGYLHEEPLVIKML